MFPPFHPPQNKTTFNAFLTSLESARQASRDNPITFPSALHLLRECGNPKSPAGSGPLHPEICRIPSSVLPDARPRLLEDSLPLSDLIVTEPLVIGVNRLSQTYHGHVDRSGCEPVDVIVKLFQQSHFRYPHSSLTGSPKAIGYQPLTWLK
jgi:hypothetical protein